MWIIAHESPFCYHNKEPVSQRESDALCLGANANVAAELAVAIFLLLHRHVHQSILTEHGASIQIGSQKVGPVNSLKKERPAWVSRNNNL